MAVNRFTFIEAGSPPSVAFLKRGKLTQLVVQIAKILG